MEEFPPDDAAMGGSRAAAQSEERAAVQSELAQNSGDAENPLEALRARPGFLIRRLHQIHTALFAEECGEHQITPLMYSVLTALAALGPVDQTTIADAVAIDKTNMADLLERLRKRGLLKRRISSKDRRVRLTVLTPEGQELLTRLEASAAQAHDRTIAALSPEERELFNGFMSRIISDH